MTSREAMMLICTCLMRKTQKDEKVERANRSSYYTSAAEGFYACQHWHTYCSRTWTWHGRTISWKRSCCVCLLMERAICHTDKVAIMGNLSIMVSLESPGSSRNGSDFPLCS